eukprot:9462908-Pyramimonas_sp.AAC.1
MSIGAEGDRLSSGGNVHHDNVVQEHAAIDEALPLGRRLGGEDVELAIRGGRQQLHIRTLR